ncbi:hypothetical protein LEN26_002730 [Aphanomyces euteiches]|uniref:WRKY19-like zinc finger domain-containing protein n=1 Tax=Aphanomyces euteiches TaxID=100861 RepID=A0A6G0XP25_9STRA|nr:hypothetical protein Ae201684_002875 [Aphanomyces euteiches]KAH9092933.1 hypothetical protein Ae201684P_008599 [Aphanomyces euteiches]KAH9129151.1 hypothetical protein AeMF1_000751 [Aphanomyces euteiches]KAH9155213.1 hypothetical protein AeRB84_002818 [Aphanomyces euteiches]KAH9158796.1 hypothetical protein LEN26_002730 [Aphanomyces euteiches]
MDSFLNMQVDAQVLVPSLALCAASPCHRFAKVTGLCLLHSHQDHARQAEPVNFLSRLLPSSNGKRRNHNRRCRFGTCRSYARGGGLCTRHGGGRKCSVPGCSTSSQTGGFCRQHGGGSKCKEPTCRQFARVAGRCLQHRQESSETSCSASQDDED